MRILSILASALFLTSCIVDPSTPDPQPPVPSGMADVSFKAELPAPGVVATRSIGSVAENKIENVYVLVFETGNDGKLIYKGKGRNLGVAAGAVRENKITFTATLPVGDYYDFVVLANAESVLSTFNVSDSPDKTRSDLMKLKRSLAVGAKWGVSSSTMDLIPMWGEINNRKLTTSEDVDDFTLTRMLARVNVAYEPVAPLDDNFQITSIRIYNYSTAGALIPAAASLDSEDLPNSKLPTAPDGGYGKQTGGYLEYTDITDGRTCSNLIYLFEAAQNGSTYDSSSNDDWRDNPCLVIGGKYKPDGVSSFPDKVTYYRIDFIQTTVNSQEEPEDKWLPILRNFSYNISITEVSGEGYDTPDVAYDSAPFNMTATVLPWNERDGKVVFDGVFYLWLSKDEFVFQRGGESGKMTDGTNAFEIMTDYMVNKNPRHAESGWHVDRIVDTQTQLPVTWLSLNPNKRDDLTWAKDVKDEVYFSFETNPGPNNREADVWIKAGRLEYKVHVVQRILSLDLVDPDVAGEPDIEEMEFIIPDGGHNGTEQRRFKVTWTPINERVSITGETSSLYPFEPAWVTGPTSELPEPGQTEYIPFQTGVNVASETYVVQPAAVTATELGLDPFYERETTYTFKVDNGSDSEEKSIKLHQIHYALVVDTYKYRLDGGTSTVTARSNAEWEIVSVEEWLYNKDPATLEIPNPTPIMLNLKTYDNLRPGTIGGPNVNGEALAFTTVNNDGGEHDGKWGTVWVTFRSTSNPEKFPEQRIALPFPPPTKLLMGLGYMDVYACNVGLPTPYHKNSAFQMLTSPYNFGSMEESSYKVDGFRVIGYNAEGLSNGNPNGEYPDYNWHPSSMKNWLNNNRPDVIVIGAYTTDTYGTRYNANEIRLLEEFVDNGGTLILMYNGMVGYRAIMAQFLEAFLDKPSGSLTHSVGGTGTTANNTDVKVWIDSPASGAYYLLENVEDPILKGPFGDVRGQYWGSHYHTGGIKTSLIDDQVIPLSFGKEQSGPNGRGHNDYTTIFRHKTKNLVWIGCDGFAASYMPAYQQGATTGYGPVYMEQNFYRPAPRTNWKAQGAASTVPTVSVYNSQLLANAIAWALDVTNHTFPDGGYKNADEL